MKIKTKNPKNVENGKKHHRKLKLNYKLIERFTYYFKKGYNIKDSCIVCDISKDTYYRWLNEGNKLKEKYNNDRELATRKERLFIDFSDLYEKGRVYFKQAQLEKIVIDKSWQSSAWTLERMFPDEFGKKDKPVIDNSKTEIQNILVLNGIGDAIAKELDRRSTEAITDESTITVETTD